MKDRELIDVVCTLNDICYDMSEEASVAFYPFEYQTDGLASCIKFMGEVVWCSEDSLEDDEIIPDLKVCVKSILESLSKIDLDELFKEIEECQC